MVRIQPPWLRLLITLLAASMLWTVGSWAGEAPPKDKPPAEAVTINRIDVPLDELELLVKPLTSEELLIETNAWLGLVKSRVEDVSAAEIAVKQKNKEIEKAKEVKQEIEKAREALDEVKDAAQVTLSDTTGEAAKEAVAAAKNAQQATEAVADKIDEAMTTAQEVAKDGTAQRALDATGVQKTSEDKSLESLKAVEAVREAKSATAAVTESTKETQIAVAQGEYADQKRKARETTAAVDDAQHALQSTETSAQKLTGSEKLEQISAQSESAAEASAEVKTEILDAVADLRAERTALIDRLNIVLDELNAKLGKTPEGKDNEVVVPSSST
jgi:small conductance mechanosensitive channel